MTIKTDAAFIPPFISFYTQIQNDRGLTNGQANFYDIWIRIGLAGLVTIHTFICYYYKTLHFSIGLN